ncbi:MAG: amino acid racemase, partial [Desulfosarcina sp.]
IERLQHSGDWAATGEILSRAAQHIEAGGADFLLICTNTMHKVAYPVAAAVKIPLLHIADATGKALRQAGIERVGLLGTAFTMEQDFYKGRLTQKFGLEVIVPNEDDRRQVHDVIYHELCLGIIKPESKQSFVEVVDRLANTGAQAVILGCTEIGLLINQADTAVPLYDTTLIHAEAAVDLAVSPSP